MQKLESPIPCRCKDQAACLMVEFPDKDSDKWTAFVVCVNCGLEGEHFFNALSPYRPIREAIWAWNNCHTINTSDFEPMLYTKVKPQGKQKG